MSWFQVSDVCVMTLYYCDIWWSYATLWCRLMEY